MGGGAARGQPGAVGGCPPSSLGARRGDEPEQGRAVREKTEGVA